MKDSFYISCNVLPQSANLPTSKVKYLRQLLISCKVRFREVALFVILKQASHSCILLQDFVNRRYIHSAGV